MWANDAWGCIQPMCLPGARARPVQNPDVAWTINSSAARGSNTPVRALGAGVAVSAVLFKAGVLRSGGQEVCSCCLPIVIEQTDERTELDAK
jgi:hypothetical protein